ncbi:MAG: mannose-1-phosphate guanylyltransferase/mannose-6-phosphate isomerase [Gammaproteobacteria bacterium]|nr:mannose-1-phosphate guanylyltransferase/mannose-6-phosphate isomerase [Gammaproteobacteria bacterium]
MSQPLVPVILSGGAGTRLWPLSRERMPKQLLPLLGDQSLLQDTLKRAEAACSTPALLVCNSGHRFQVAEQLQSSGCSEATIMLEPMGRNTAPAIAVAAYEALMQHGAGAQLLVMPADHVIVDTEAFAKAVGEAARLAGNHRAVAFGIRATRPETGFGYLEAGNPIAGFTAACEIAAFVEKPDLARAEAFVEGGRHFWNGGMFLFPAVWLLKQLAALEPEMAACAEKAWSNARRDADFVRLDAAAFERSPSNSIDYALMERIDGAAMVTLDAGWDDVGSFTALWQLGKADADGVVTVGDVLSDGNHDCYLRADHRLVAALGVRDLIVVETADAVLVAHRDAVQDVKRVVEALRSEGRTALLRDPPSRPAPGAAKGQ